LLLRARVGYVVAQHARDIDQEVSGAHAGAVIKLAGDGAPPLAV
jgi:hypothetical protein